MKIKSVLESELAFFKSESLALRAGFEEFKSTTNSELTEFGSTLIGVEQSLSSFTDEVPTLHREVFVSPDCYTTK